MQAYRLQWDIESCIQEKAGDGNGEKRRETTRESSQGAPAKGANPRGEDEPEDGTPNPAVGKPCLQPLIVNERLPALRGRVGVQVT